SPVHDLLLISDLHLGSHLKPRMRGEFVHLASKIEDTFPRFIDHYLREGRLQLIINGDFIDFWNVELPGQENLPPEALAVARLHAVFDAHPQVEDALVRFLGQRGSIVFVTGNHDAELLYEGVREAIVERLEGALRPAGEDWDASITRTGHVRLDELPAGRIRFIRWFLREQGGAWIEHGHTFDPSCATPARMSPTRGDHLVQTVAEVATRNFSNWMPEIDYDAPDKFSGMDYARWALARGWRFVLRVMLLYLRTAGRILALWAGGRADKKGKAEHDERLARVAANAGLQMSTLAALQAMAPPPSATKMSGLLSLTAIDFLLSLTLPPLLGVLLAGWVGAPRTLGLMVGAAVAALLVWRLRRGRKRRDVAGDMLEVAAGVGEVTGVPLVLMGHSHHGELRRLGDVVYANSGSWLDGSHLVVRRDRESGRLVSVELRHWRNGGTTRLSQMDVPWQAWTESAAGADAGDLTQSASLGADAAAAAQ
ncbi:MAG: metallophosphoesterase, partial [Myxococcota bacterium]